VGQREGIRGTLLALQLRRQRHEDREVVLRGTLVKPLGAFIGTSFPFGTYGGCLCSVILHDVALWCAIYKRYPLYLCALWSLSAVIFLV
jgi:hypothetical protein